MAKVTISDPKTGATAELELELRVAGDKATISSGQHALWDLLGEWSPNGVGNLEFDLQTEGHTLRRCKVERMGGTMGIDFMERE